MDNTKNRHLATFIDLNVSLTDQLYSHSPSYTFDAVPTIWIKNAPIKTFYESYLSFTLPLLEDFMIDTIKEAMPEISDQLLLRNAKIFCDQEQNHAEQHAQFNQRLYALGLDDSNIKESQKNFQHKLSKTSLNERLQITAFLEGVTAGFAYEIICKRFLVEEWHPQAQELYLWHCVEEYEHRCLAFDVYLETVKKHKPSIILITRAIAPLLFCSIKFMLTNLRKHKLLWTKQTFMDAFWFIGLHGPVFYILKCYYRFFRSNYHPQYVYFNPEIESAALKWETDFHNGT